jgi:hypothetical protein
MSIRVGLYDFFAYTLPGIFYLAIIEFWLATTGLLVIDFSILKNFSLEVLFATVGAGYIIALLIDPIAYGCMRLFYQRNRDVAKAAYDEFTQRHSWVHLNYDAKDWGILLRGVKSVSMEAAADVEQHNVAFIMLRNISFAFVLCLISSVIYFFFFLPSPWILGLGVLFVIMAILAMRRSRVRRYWFYMAVFEAFTAHFLLNSQTAKEKVKEKSNLFTSKASRKVAPEKKRG